MAFIRLYVAVRLGFVMLAMMCKNQIPYKIYTTKENDVWMYMILVKHNISEFRCYE